MKSSVATVLLFFAASYAGDFLAHENRVPGRYVVVLKKGYPVEEVAPFLAERYGGKASKDSYFNRLKLKDGIEGFVWVFESVEQGDRQAARAAAQEEVISYVEMSVPARSHDTIRGSLFADTSQFPQNSLSRADSLSYKADGFVSFTHTGDGVTVYVLDDAAEVSHDQFRRLYNEPGGTRATNWRDATVPVGAPPVFFANNNSHGLAMAACAVGLSFGVARRALVRVIDVDNAGGSGFTEDNLERGIGYILAEYNTTTGPVVVNASFGYPETMLFANQQFMRLAAAGIPVTVSAGNDSGDALRFSPSNLSSMIVVGNADGRTVLSNPFTPIEPSSDSNFGPSVDLYAVGDFVPSAQFMNAHTAAPGGPDAATQRAPHHLPWRLRSQRETAASRHPAA
jgi:hypothetical protein